MEIHQFSQTRIVCVTGHVNDGVNVLMRIGFEEVGGFRDGLVAVFNVFGIGGFVRSDKYLVADRVLN
jgi:hypothetical protein